MSADQLIAAITAIVTDVNALVKLGLIIGLAVYVLIALIIYRQMSVLGSSVHQVVFSTFLKILALLHLILTLVLFVYIIIVL